MNQFKKAKQKLIEQGKDVEPITDLKTAGIKKPEETASSVKQEPQDAPVKKDDSLQEKEQILNTVSKDYTAPTNISQKDIVQPIVIASDEAVQPPVIEIPANNVENTVPVVSMAPQNTIIIDKPTPETPAFITQDVKTEKVPVATPVAKAVPPIQPTMTSQQIAQNILQDITFPTQQSTVNTSYVASPYQEEEQVITPMNSIESVPNRNAEISSSVVTQMPETRFVLQDSKPQAELTPQVTHPVKKSIPNIFAPKDEAKSMRKSLVLKPSSVKKAENYCSKNGGSFNELVQTLLDNFISEYGL